MPRINLLPWREELRRRRNKEFGVTAVVFAVLSLVVIAAVHVHYDDRIDFQKRRNQFLTAEIAKLDKKIAEIKELDAERERIQKRIDIIQDLQSSRPEIVRLMDEIVRALPEGIYFQRLVLQGRTLTLEGIAQSNARVSSLMRNFEASELLENPQLLEIKREDRQTGDSVLRLSRFSLRVQQRSLAEKTDGEEGAAS